MFQRIHKQKEPDDHLSQEGEGSVHGGGAGNEAALVNNLITNESNEANNTLIENLIIDEENNRIDAPDSENEFRLAHYIENDIKHGGLKRPNKKANREREKNPILFNEAKNAGLDGNNERIYNDSPDYESRNNIILGDGEKILYRRNRKVQRSKKRFRKRSQMKALTSIIRMISTELNGNRAERGGAEKTFLSFRKRMRNS